MPVPTTRRAINIAILAGCYLFVLLTNSGFAQAPTGDAIDYRQIAAAAPGLPDEVGSAYAGRFVVHYLVGVVAHATGMSLDLAYGLSWGLLMLVLAAVLLALFGDLPTGDFAVCAALFVLSPYALRPYALQTGMVQDLVFVIGCGICLFGLRRYLVRWVLIGLLLAAVGRQSVIAVAPVVAIWLLFDPGWRVAVDTARRRWAAVAALTVTYGMFAAIKLFTAPFSGDYEPSILRDSVLTRIGDLPGAAGELAAHFARTAVPLVVPGAAALALLLVVGVRRAGFGFYAALAFAAAIVAQPAMINPAWPGFAYNEQRLSALALLPLVYAVAVLLPMTTWRGAATVRTAAALALLAIASLHHEFSVVGPNSLPQFLITQFAAALAVAALLLTGRRRPADRLEPTAR